MARHPHMCAEVSARKLHSQLRPAKHVRTARAGGLWAFHAAPHPGGGLDGLPVGAGEGPVQPSAADLELPNRGLLPLGRQALPPAQGFRMGRLPQRRARPVAVLPVAVRAEPGVAAAEAEESGLGLVMVPLIIGPRSKDKFCLFDRAHEKLSVFFQLVTGHFRKGNSTLTGVRTNTGPNPAEKPRFRSRKRIADAACAAAL